MKRLTLKDMEKAYENAMAYGNSSDFVISQWKIPFLWVLYFFFGYTITSENIKMWWVDFRGVKYLLKSEANI